jgi:hypothetical protein
MRCLSAAGFGIEAVKLSGQREINEFQILEALEIHDGHVPGAVRCRGRP